MPPCSCGPGFNDPTEVDGEREKSWAGLLLMQPELSSNAGSAKKQARLLGTVAPMNGIIARITVSTGGASWWVLEVEAANDRVELR
ncbi:hypothetical protein M4951_10115 [Blastopirellula sp. J2-11]|uniref:hypothetical protein n=1 Tax=Blastopirellula sp. J2-11 TaxID=2943192 RepID=UPI0021C947D9|nr:hypothetical protein [Blastopirellula sp. J2-11]UUO08652.1 hypothetical protein M4951_10115 [Blastopirellula sp. J2-11]